MKKITFLFILLLTMTNWSYSQCTSTAGGNYGNLVMANDGTAEQIAADNWPNAKFSVIEGLIVGNTYTVTGTNTTSIYITVTETTPAIDAIGTVITHGASTVSFTATTAQILIFWNLDSLCGTQASDATLTTIQCTSPSCSCTFTTAPGAPTGPTPADMAIDVPIDISGATPLITPFSWVEDAVNDPATSFTISLGTDTAASNIGSITGATNGNGLTYTGWTNNTVYYWKVTAINCVGTIDSAIWSFTTSSCTATAGPDLATAPAPSDTAIDIPIDISDPANLLITPFSWVEATTGDLATSYNLTLGTTTTGDDIGTITGATNGNGVTYTWAYDTTYYWKVDAVNCFGTTTGTVWEFKTEIDPALSTSEFDKQQFSVYPNPAKNTINIKSDVSFDSVEIYNQLGQRVINVNASDLVENSININELTNGIYFMKIMSEDKQQTIKFIKE